MLKNSVNETKDELQSTGSGDHMEQREHEFKGRMIQVDVRTELRFLSFFFLMKIFSEKLLTLLE